MWLFPLLAAIPKAIALKQGRRIGLAVCVVSWGRLTGAGLGMAVGLCCGKLTKAHLVAQLDRSLSKRCGT